MMNKGLEDFKQYVSKKATPGDSRIIFEWLHDYEKSFKPSQEKTPKVSNNEQTKEVCGHTQQYYVWSFDSYYCPDCKRYID